MIRRPIDSRCTSTRQTLVAKGQVLRDGLVVTLSIRNIQVGKVVSVQEKHVHRLVQALESRCIVWELVAGVCGTCVAQEDALNLAGEVGGHFGVVAHDVAVACVCDEDKLALGEGLEDLLQEELSD